MDADESVTGAWRRGAIACLALAVASCSPGMQFGDVISPVGWIKSTTDSVTKVFDGDGEDEGPTPLRTTYPDLNTVPVRTEAPTTPSERQRLLRELEQDRSRWPAEDSRQGPPQGTGKRSSLWPNAAPAIAAGAGQDMPEPAVLVAPSPDDLAPVRPVASGDPTRDAAGVVHFGHGSTRLSEADTRLVAGLATWIRRYDLRVRVVGHASARTATGDPVEALLANFRTSLERANSVAEVLVRHGVSSRQVTVEAAGSRRPVAGDEAGSRRADIFLETS